MSKVFYAPGLVIVITIIALQSLSVNNSYSQGMFGDLENKLEDLFGNVFSTNNLTLSEPLVLTNYSAKFANPLMVTTGDNTYTAWLSGNESNLVHLSMAVDKKFNGSFQNRLEIGDEMSPLDNPIIQAAGKNVYVVWDHDNGTNRIIKFKASDDNGTTFGTTKDIGTLVDFNSPKIVAVDDEVYMTWLKERDGLSEIMFTSSLDGGKTFSDSSSIFNSTSLLSSPVLSLDGNNLYVAWNDQVPGSDRLYMISSSDKGKIFNLPTVIATSIFPPFTMAATNQKVFFVWQDGNINSMRVYAKTSNDSGLTFSEPFELGTKPGVGDIFVTSSQGDISIAWIDLSNPNATLTLRNSANDSNKFLQNSSPIDRISVENYPSISRYGTNVYIGWVNASGIFVKTSLDGGINFEQTKVVSRNSETTVSAFPIFVPFDERIFIMWQELYTTADETLGNRVLLRSGTVSNQSGPFS